MLPLLQIYFDRLRASEIDTGSIARALADAVREADKSAAAGVYLRDYAGETLFLAGCSPGNGAAESDAPSLSADNWDDPLCYCIHTGAPAHFQRICELPASARLLAFPTPESVRSYGIFPIPAAGGGVAGAVIALHDEASPAHRRICHYLCQFAGLLFSLAGEKKCSRHALRSMEEDVRQLNERRAAADPLHPDGPKRPALVGDSRATSALRQAVDRAARSDSPLLLTGETGTGKSLLARLAHAASKRRDGPFLEINCASFPPDLLESELFGHVRGAFSGAVASHKGLLRSAQGGTVLLDEIGEMPPHLQAVLLQALQDRKVRPVGGTTFQPLNIRIIAATNRDLDRALADGSFRRDLYHRLAVLKIHIPPLRERREDIPALCSLFLELCARKLGRSTPRFTPEAGLILLGQPYPGNVRELEALVERVVNLAPEDRDELGPEYLITEGDRLPRCISLAEFRQMQEKWYMQQAGKLYRGDLRACAEALGVHPRTLRRRLGKQGIAPDRVLAFPD